MLTFRLYGIFFFLAATSCGCSIYLHDDNLQKQTAKGLDNYKSADVVGTMQTVLDGQIQLDNNDIRTVADNETAERERAVSDLISAYKQTKPATVRLNKRVNDRIKELAGNASISPDDWKDLREKRIEVKTLDDDLQRQLQAKVRAFKAAGGKNFTSCKDFKGPEGLPATVQDAARKLKTQCDIVALSSQPLDDLQKPINRLLNATFPGEIAKIDQQLIEVEAQIEREKVAQTKILAELQAAQEKLKRDGKDPTAIDDEVRTQLQNLDTMLKDVDNAAGLAGDKTLAPGKALAAIQFRKTNLRNVIAESGQKADSTGTADTDAAKTSRAIVGVIAGLIELSDTANGVAQAPSVPALSVALAFQDGLEKVVEVQLNALMQQRMLLQDQEDALLRELEFLVAARVASDETGVALKPSSCAPNGFGEIFLNAACTSARTSAARALSAFNVSWASGRTAARIADRKITQLIVWKQLRVSQEAAVARTNIQTIMLTKLAAYGEGGVKPETIAAFLQAVGMAAIARGVN